MPTRRELLGAAGAAALLPGCAMMNSPLRTGEQAQTFSGIVRKQVSLRYLMWLPESSRRPAAGWPLLIFLHGSGERGEELARVKVHGPPKYAAAGRDFPFVLVAPQLAAEQQWDPDALDALRADLVARLPVDPDRVLLTGMSLGGHGTWDCATEFPDRFAAIAPVCGIGVPSRAMRLATLPIWAFHGALDEVVPLAPDRLMVEAVRAAGGRPKFTVYPDIGHNAWDPAYADPALYEWLLAQRRGQPMRD